MLERVTALMRRKAGAARRRLLPNVRTTERQALTQSLIRTRSKLFSLGFVERALEEFEQVLANDRNPAARAIAAQNIALWHLRRKNAEGYRIALDYTRRLPEKGAQLNVRRQVALIRLLCHYRLDETDEAENWFRQLRRDGLLTPDILMTFAGFQEDPRMKLLYLNQAMKSFELAPLRLTGDPGLPLYDRLDTEKLAPRTGGPKVSILIAAYNAAATIGTTLRSLRAQTWQNHEILVIDDCSRDDTAEVVRKVSAEDPRVRLIELDVNSGAYVARNRGLDEARGAYVTIHDADDWSHPQKLETQIDYLEQHPEVMGCTTQQARATEDLVFSRITGSGALVNVNTSSFMFRREPVATELGGWDTVRFGADNEWIERIRYWYGKSATVKLKTGPLSFQRISGTSVVADEVRGIEGFYYGVRKHYREMQQVFHQRGATLNYRRIEGRPFPVPALMSTLRQTGTSTAIHVDLLVAAELRQLAPTTRALIERVPSLVARGLKVGLVTLYDYELDVPEMCPPALEVQDLLLAGQVRMVVFGESVVCTRLVLPHPESVRDLQRYVPEVQAASVDLVAPSDNEVPDAGRRQFGRKPRLVPFSALIEELSRMQAGQGQCPRAAEPGAANIRG